MPVTIPITLVAIIACISPPRVGIEVGEPQPPSVVRFADGGGLSASYVQDAARTLGPVQRLSLSNRAMFDHFIEDLTGLHLLARRAEEELLARQSNLAHRVKLARDRMLATAWIDAELERRRPITDEELRRFFERNIDHFQSGERVRSRQILLPTREQAEEVATRLRQGERFGELALRYSIHPSAQRRGEMGWHQTRHLEPALHSALNSRALGARTPVINTRFGFHLLELQERQGPEPIAYEEVRDRVEREMRKQRRRELSQELVEELRESAGATVDDEVANGLFNELTSHQPDAAPPATDEESH